MQESDPPRAAPPVHRVGTELPVVTMTWPQLTARTQTVMAAAAIALSALAVYHNCFRAPFVFDDGPAVLGNSTIRQLGTAWRALGPAVSDSTVNGRPVPNFTLAINYAFSGTDVWSYHALNLLIHILGGLTLFGVVRRTLQLPPLRERLGRDALPLALAAAALWVVHPVQTEAVTYIVQRVESLMGLFYLLTLYCFIRAVEGTTRPLTPDQTDAEHAGFVGRGPWSRGPGSSRPLLWYALSILCCVLGMASKEVMVTAPVMVLLYDRTFLAGSFRAAWRQRRGWYLALGATWLPLSWLVAGTGWNRGGSAGFNVGVAAPAYWLTQAEAVTRYLWLALWPHPLVIDYGTHWVHRVGEVAPYAVVLILLAAATLLALWRRPVPGFVGAWFFAILAPTSVMPGTTQMIVEHRVYLPLAAIVVGGVAALRAWTGRHWWRVTMALVVGWGVLTAQRNEDYRSELALWGDAVAKRPANATARLNLGLALSLAGRTPEAMGQFQAALQIQPDNAEAHNNLGIALDHSGHLPEAIEHYQAALRIRPDLAGTHYDLAEALAHSGRIPEAIEHYAAALKIKPDFVRAQYHLAVLLDHAGSLPAAIAHYQAALQINPDNAEAHNNLGDALFRTGRTVEAAREYEAALGIQPDFARAHYNLGLALVQLERVTEAIRHYETALRLQPDFAEAANNLGALLCQQGRNEEGVAKITEALRLRPGFARARFNLGNALAQAGQIPDAIRQFEEAVRLQPDLAEARNNLGMLLCRTGRISEGILSIKEALRIKPDFAPAHFSLGTALLQCGRTDEAIAEYEEVLRLRPDDPSARRMLDLARSRQPAAGSSR